MVADISGGEWWLRRVKQSLYCGEQLQENAADATVTAVLMQLQTVK